jgi:hypothetical protein
MSAPPACWKHPDGAKPSIDLTYDRDLELQTAAEIILAHLRVCGWTFAKAPPALAHATHDNDRR